MKDMWKKKLEEKGVKNPEEKEKGVENRDRDK